MSKQTQNFYDHFSPFYPLVDLFLKPQKRRLFYEINQLPFGQLLEIGVGNGTHLPQYKTHAVTGIDASFKMLQQAKKNATPNMQLVQMNGEALLFKDQSFDYVVLSHVIAVVENPEILLEETYRVLKPGGKIFILNHFTPPNWLRHIDHAFQNVSKHFHFKSAFHLTDLTALKKFTLVKEISFGRLSYFKLLIYCKG